MGSFLWTTHTPLGLFFLRMGISFGLVDGRRWGNVWMTFLQPVYFTYDGFTGKVTPTLTHSIFVHALAILFYIGAISAFLLKGRLWRLWFTLLWIWIITSGFVGVVGIHPQSLLYALLPVYFALTSYGLHRLITAIGRSSLPEQKLFRWALTIAIGLFIIFYPLTELSWVLRAAKTDIAASYENR